MRGSHTFSKPMPGAVSCLSCGPVSLGMTLAETEVAVTSANAQLQPGESPIGLSDLRCYPRPRYRLAVLGDVPDGATIGPALAEGTPTCKTTHEIDFVMRYTCWCPLKSEEPLLGCRRNAIEQVGPVGRPCRRYDTNDAEQLRDHF